MKLRDGRLAGVALTLYRMTPAGRRALTGYVQALRQLLGSVIDT